MPVFTNHYGQNIPYYIGEMYQYDNGVKLQLLAIDEQKHRFYFESYHWCTDNVFMDLIRVKTGVHVFETVTKQLQLF